MGLLERWRPREMDRFRSEFDDLLERFGFDRDWFPRMPFERVFAEGALRPAIESCVEGDKFVVRTDLPGVEPKDVDIKVVGNMLTIKGSREEKRETKKPDFFRREIRYGSFERSIELPEGIKAEDLKATYQDGVLQLTAPMPKEATPKEIKIEVDGSKESPSKKPHAA